MAMGKVPGDSEGGDDVGFAEINITPLTDLFLVLLIIFMVTSTVIVQQGPGGGAKAGLKVNLPKGGAADASAGPSDDDERVAQLQSHPVTTASSPAGQRYLAQSSPDACCKTPRVSLSAGGYRCETKPFTAYARLSATRLDHPAQSNFIRI